MSVGNFLRLYEIVNYNKANSVFFSKVLLFPYKVLKPTVKFHIYENARENAVKNKPKSCISFFENCKFDLKSWNFVASVHKEFENHSSKGILIWKFYDNGSITMNFIAFFRIRINISYLIRSKFNYLAFLHNLIDAKCTKLTF